MIESTIEKRLRKAVTQLGGRCAKFVSPGWRGVPDRIVLMPYGRIWFVELKAPGKKPRAEQIVVHEKLRALGFDVRVIDTVEEVDRFVAEIYAASISG